MKSFRLLNVFLLLTILYFNANAQDDTLKVMTYNVLNYGDVCQGNNKVMRTYLNKIIAYTQPDILGLVKMQPVKRTLTDINGYLPIDFCDSMVTYVLNPGGNIQYSYCKFTNEARGADMNVLFYNKQKLGYLYTNVLTVNITDFDLFKFYYKDSNLLVTNDSTYLYIVLFHTQSGKDATTRNAQLASTLASLQSRFSKLPNIIMMGDFNLRTSVETGYNTLVNNTNKDFQFNDPPFSPDKQLTYPASWQGNNIFSKYFTTSTRFDLVHPNSCGTDGGAKDWYDHILFSPWMLTGENFISYVPNSYKTIGNDGNHFGLSINDSTSAVKNSSAPDSVINAIYQLSNKYPVMSSIAIKSNLTGISPKDPELYYVGAKEIEREGAFFINITNPIDQQFILDINPLLAEMIVNYQIVDSKGMYLTQSSCLLKELTTKLNAENIPQGIFILRVNNFDNSFYHMQKLLKMH